MIEKYGKYDSNWAKAKMMENIKGGKMGYSFAGDLTEQVYQRIALTGGVSFVELKQTFPEEFDKFKGVTMCNANYPNIIYWVNISDEMIKALTFLLSEKLITMEPTTQLTYIIDGVRPDMPLATRIYNYKKPRWLPVTFSSNIKKNELL